ncbi:MAG: hypothetical protein MZV70_69815 [Desulfobacterales bacterium]|nr:hypothetical protein [Desulfobacterales bacterium]
MVPPEELERLAGTVHHQGAVAMIETPDLPALDAPAASGWAVRGERVLVLDNLGNDHNLGAVVRSAAFFGIPNLVLAGPSASSLVTTSAFRVAEGGMEWVSLYRVSDVGELARLAGPSLRILGADHRGALDGPGSPCPPCPRVGPPPWSWATRRRGFPRRPGFLLRPGPHTRGGRTGKPQRRPVRGGPALRDGRVGSVPAIRGRRVPSPEIRRHPRPAARAARPTHSGSAARSSRLTGIRQVQFESAIVPGTLTRSARESPEA